MALSRGRRESVEGGDKGANTKDWLEKYLGASEEIDEGLPEPWGRPLRTTVYFDSDHAHDQMTRRSVSDVVYFVGWTSTSCTSKRQGTIESYIYSAEFCAGRVASEEAITLWFMLSSLGVPIIGAT